MIGREVSYHIRFLYSHTGNLWTSLLQENRELRRGPVPVRIPAGSTGYPQKVNARYFNERMT